MNIGNKVRRIFTSPLSLNILGILNNAVRNIEDILRNIE